MSSKLQENDLALFRRLIPIKDLPPSSISDLAEKVSVFEYPDGRVLFSQGDQDSESFYLLSGEIEIEGGGVYEVIRAGSGAALLPLGHDMPRVVTATTKGAARFFQVNNTLLEIALSGDSQGTVEVEEISEDDEGVENQLFLEIYREYMEGTLKLPTLPELALRVRKAVNDPEISLADIAKIIQADQAITGRLIEVANSPLYRTEVESTSCIAAIRRLGLDNTRDLVTTFAMKQLFNNKNKLLSNRMRSLWGHSTHIAAISAVLADMTPSLNTDRAMLSGLIHDIGVLAIYGYVADRPELMKDPKALDEAVLKLRGQVGAMVLRKWFFASDLVTVVLEADNVEYDSEFGPDYADVVVIAQIHSYFGTPRASKFPPMFELPAFGKLPLSQLGPEKSVEALAEARKNIDEMRRLLT